MDIYSVIELTKVKKSDIMRTYKLIFRVYNHSIEDLLWSKDILSLLMSDNILSTFHIEIDATAVIISAIIKDQQHEMSVNNSILDAQDICCLYSMALIKFCNILPFYKYDVNKKSIIRERKKIRNSIAEVSKNLSIPEWLVECRHMACHTSSTSLILLRQACFIALSWLDKNFWRHFVNFKASPRTSNFKSEAQNAFNELMSICSENHCFLNKSSLLLNKIIRLSKVNKKESFEIVASILVSHDLIVNTFDISNGNIEGLTKLQKFCKIILLITENNPVSLIFDALINHFSSSNTTYAKNAIFWFIFLLKCLGKYEFSLSIDFKRNFLKNRNEFTKIEWIQLLYKVMMNPNEYTNLIINLIVDFYPSLLSKHYMDLLSKLVRTLLYPEFSELKNEADLKTLQDVLSVN